MFSRKLEGRVSAERARKLVTKSGRRRISRAAGGVPCVGHGQPSSLTLSPHSAPALNMSTTARGNGERARADKNQTVYIIVVLVNYTARAAKLYVELLLPPFVPLSETRNYRNTSSPRSFVDYYTRRRNRPETLPLPHA